MTTEETPIQIAINKLGDFWETEQDFRMTEYIHIHEMLVGLLLTEKQKTDEFAIGFAEWCIKKRVDFFDDTEIGETYTIDGFVSRYKMEELLEMYKKEKKL